MSKPRNAPRQRKPDDNLDRLDEWEPTSVRMLYRCHESIKGPWYFSSAPTKHEPGPGGRWELADPQGTCHTGTEAAAALWERFGPDYHDLGFVPQDAIERTSVTFVEPDTDIRVADLQGPTAPSLGVTSELATTSDYEMTRAWAEAIWQAGWNAVKAASRFAPEHSIVALFGPAGQTECAPGSHGNAGSSITLARQAGLLTGNDYRPPQRSMRLEPLPDDIS